MKASKEQVAHIRSTFGCRSFLHFERSSVYGCNVGLGSGKVGHAKRALRLLGLIICFRGFYIDSSNEDLGRKRVNNTKYLRL